MNQTLIHAAVELVVMTGVIVYFNKQTSKLQQTIDDLQSQVKSLKDDVHKYERQIKHIFAILDTMSHHHPQPVYRAPASHSPSGELKGVRRRNVVKKEMEVQEEDKEDLHRFENQDAQYLETILFNLKPQVNKSKPTVEVMDDPVEEFDLSEELKSLEPTQNEDENQNTEINI